MNIYIGSFSKDKHSTKQPLISSLNALTVELKRDTSIMFPVFRITEDNYDISYNYIYVPSWRRYYYIDNATAVMGGIWELACTEDCLASWKTEIGSDTYYILRSSAVSNGDITDDYYPTEQDATVQTTLGSNIFPVDLTQGYYVVGIVSRAAYSNAGGMGAVAYYVMNSSQFRLVMEYLLESSSWTGVPASIAQGGLDHQLLKALYNPFQYIVSCKWFPFQPPTSGYIGGSLPYGWWNIEMSAPGGIIAAKLGVSPVYEIDTHIDILPHPQAATRGRYLNGAPFRKLEFVAGPFGVIPIDSNAMVGYDKLGFTVRCDCITGEGMLLTSAGIPEGGDGANTDRLFPIHRAQMGVDIQIAQMAVDMLTQAETVITGALDTARDTSMAIGRFTDIKHLVNPASGVAETAAAGFQAASTATHAIADGIRSSVPGLQISGTQGSIMNYYGRPAVLHTFYNLVTEDLAHIGRPYCATGSPATLGNGFYMMKRGEFSSNANSVEKNVIGSFLESGFLYE